MPNKPRNTTEAAASTLGRVPQPNVDSALLVQFEALSASLPGRSTGATYMLRRAFADGHGFAIQPIRSENSGDSE